MVKISKFDVLDHLDSEEVIEEYLKAAKEEGSPDLLRAALSNAAKARAALLGKEAELEHENLTD